jgi:hypothetical protein
MTLVARLIWLLRNDVVFRNVSPSVEATLQHAFSMGGVVVLGKASR